MHVRISAPPVKWPCFYGIDFATRAELIANGLDTEEICRSIGADSLGYVSLEGLVAATQVGKQALCRACFDGVYPVELPLSERLGKSILEETAADLEPVVSGIGACRCPHPPLTPRRLVRVQWAMAPTELTSRRTRRLGWTSRLVTGQSS